MKDDTCMKRVNNDATGYERSDILWDNGQKDDDDRE